MPRSRVAAALAGSCVATLFVACVQAHPLAQGRVELVVYPNKVTLWARVTLEQVLVQLQLPINDKAQVETQADVYRLHGAYLLQHVFLSADGKALTGKVISFAEPDVKAVYPDEAQKQFVTYEIEYPLEKPPQSIELKQNVLHEVFFTENNPWEATYITGFRQAEGGAHDNFLLTSSNTLKFACDWAKKTTAPPLPASLPVLPPKELAKPLPERDHTLEFAAGLAVVAIAYAGLSWIRTKRSKT